MKSLQWTLSAAIAALLLAGCGGSETKESPAAPPSPPAVTEASPPPSPPPTATPPASSDAKTEDRESEPAGRAFPRPAPPLKFTAHDGRSVSLDDLKGKVVLVMYFSTDCPHCQTTAETLAPIYAELKPQGLEVVGLALNPTAKTNLGGFIGNYRVAFPVGLANRAGFARFAGLSVMARFYYPYLLFVDREGNLREEHQGSDGMYFADLNASLRQTLGALIAEPVR